MNFHSSPLSVSTGKNCHPHHSNTQMGCIDQMTYIWRSIEQQMPRIICTGDTGNDRPFPEELMRIRSRQLGLVSMHVADASRGEDVKIIERSLIAMYILVCGDVAASTKLTGAIERMNADNGAHLRYIEEGRSPETMMYVFLTINMKRDTRTIDQKICCLILCTHHLSLVHPSHITHH